VGWNGFSGIVRNGQEWSGIGVVVLLLFWYWKHLDLDELRVYNKSMEVAEIGIT
jgi:hypothetical protein